jgi:hypothetical protein
VNKSMQILPFARRFLSIEGITVFKFNDIAMLTSDSSFEYYEIWLCRYRLNRPAFLDGGFRCDEHPVWIDVLLEEPVKVVDNRSSLDDGFSSSLPDEITALWTLLMSPPSCESPKRRV